jgi:DNA (cytosine-5)-methyltransferase 1
MLRIIRETKPRWVLVENVGGFASLALDLVLSGLEEEGYEAGAIVLPALAVGAPHRRDRCFVLGYAEHHGQDAAEKRKGTGKGVFPKEKRESCPFELTRPGVQRGKLGRDASVANAEGERQERKACIGKGVFAGVERRDRRGEVESRLGGVLDGVSDRLDAQMRNWPAWRGEAQKSFEPPRGYEGEKERNRRIESLGLAVVPWQAYPLFALIKEMDDILHAGDFFISEYENP